MTRYLLLLLPLLFLACPKQQEIKLPDTAEQALEQGIELLEARKYGRAEETFTAIIFNFPGSRPASDAQYWLAETYFRDRDYVKAQTEYDFYLKSFPNGRFQEQATVNLALSHFRAAPSGGRDQSRIKQALGIIEEFIQLYPESDLIPEARRALGEMNRRLTQKDFDVALLYFKAGEYRSALVYYQYILDKLGMEGWDAPDLLNLADCYAETGDAEKARPVLELLTGESFPPDIRNQARSRLAGLD